LARLTTEICMKKRLLQLVVCITMVLAMCQGFFCLTATARNDSLRVAFKTNMPFYQFTNEQGNAVGLHIDIMDAIVRELGWDIVYLPVETSREAMELLETREADLILGMPYYLETDYVTTSEISSSETALIAPKALVESNEKLDISKYRIALEYGITNQLVVTNFRAKQYISTGSQKRVLETHLSGKAELMVCDRACMEYLLRKHEIWEDYTVVQGQLDEPGYTIAVNKSNTKLRREIDNALMSIRLSGEYEEILEKWIPKAEDGTERLKKIILSMAAVLIIVGGAMSIYIYVQYKIRKVLEKEVAEKTKALNGKVLQLSYESELRNRIIEHSPNGMVLVDWDGKITLINKSACQMANVEKTVAGTGIFRVVFFACLLEQVGIRDRSHLLQGIREQTLSMSDSMNMERIYQLMILPTYNEDQCTGVLLTVEDITAREEQRIATSEKEKNQIMNRLIAGMAHEIKNPLTGIRNFADLIRTKRNDPRFLDYFAELVPEEVDRISRLVENLMQYARPPKGKCEKLDVSEVLRECAAWLHPIIFARDEIHVEMEIEEHLYIGADRDQIKQVFINLFMNGVNAVERKLQREEKIASPAMRITAEEKGEFVIVTVLDYGVGMTPDEVKKCTEPFFTTRAQGNGLGLAMSKRFIQENDGIMWIESEKDVQTCMTVRFRRYRE